MFVANKTKLKQTNKQKKAAATLFECHTILLGTTGFYLNKLKDNKHIDTFLLVPFDKT